MIDKDVADKLRGRFIVFDGPDGCGKSTQLAKVAEALRQAGGDVVTTRDPGGTELGERIRGILLGGHLNVMDVRCETLLFMASRAQLLGEVVEPALSRGSIVLCDRFISSTCAYQGAAGYDVDRVIALGELMVAGHWPDLTIVLDLPADLGMDRVHRRGRGESNGSAPSAPSGSQTVAAVDAMESRPIDFHRRVAELFRDLPSRYPSRVEVVDAAGSIEDVHRRIIEVIRHVDL